MTEFGPGPEGLTQEDMDATPRSQGGTGPEKTRRARSLQNRIEHLESQRRRSDLTLERLRLELQVEVDKHKERS